MAAKTQVCYMPCNAKSRRQEKHNENRTGKENQQRVSPKERLFAPPHAQGMKGMPVHVCPYRRKHNKATTATEEQNGMKGQNGGTQNQQRREEHMEEATHNRGEAQHTHKKDRKEKLNVHNMHKRRTPHRPPRHKCKYVTCRAMPRNEHEIRTTTTPKRVTTRCNRDVPIRRHAHPRPHARLHRERKGVKGMPARACRRKRTKTTTAANKQNDMGENQGRHE